MAQYRAPTTQKPTLDQLGDIANEVGFHMSPDELAEYKALVDGSITLMSPINDIPEPVLLPVKYPRTPGYRPPPEENKYNAWYYKTDIKGAPSGKLYGKTIALKDNVAVAGVPMMNGSKLLEGYTPEYDATVVTRILDAGGNIAGKAVCEDMCFSGSSCSAATGPISNPHDNAHSAGGSSSGVGVLVQTGEVDMGMGGDQGGSIRIPASRVGIVGLKPTHGLVPYTGIVPIEPTIDHTGPMARTVKDCALLLEVVAGFDGLDPRQPPRFDVPEYSTKLNGDLTGMKVGLLQEGFSGCDTAVSELVEACAKSLAKAGATVQETSVPWHQKSPLFWGPVGQLGGYVTMFKNAGCSMGYKGFQSTSLIDHMTKSVKVHANDISPMLKMVVLHREYLQRNYGNRFYAKSQNVTMTLTKAYDDALKTYDVLVMPTMDSTAPKLPPKDASATELIRHCFTGGKNTCPFNLTGHPALSINAGFIRGLPVGMMIVGKKFDESTVLNVAHAFEGIRDGSAA